MSNHLFKALVAAAALMAICLANAPQLGRIDSAVSLGSSVDLQNKRPIGQWLERLIKPRQHFEIPNYPLDEQPDPSKLTHIDADLRGCTNPIQNQLSCGACYAFSWLAYAEWHLCFQDHGHLKKFSEQHIIDCGHKAHLGGCESGYLPETIEFSRVFSFIEAQDYPYRGQKGTCRDKNMSGHKAQIDAKRIPFNRTEWEQVLYEQPILAQVNLPLDIGLYSRGIHPGNNCDPRKPHGMLLVGHGRHEGKPYWLLRNSMGESWGENGYLRLSRDAPADCMKTGFIAKIHFKMIDRRQSDYFYEQLEYQPNLQPIYSKMKSEYLRDRYRW